MHLEKGCLEKPENTREYQRIPRRIFYMYNFMYSMVITKICRRMVCIPWLLLKSTGEYFVFNKTDKRMAKLLLPDNFITFCTAVYTNPKSPIWLPSTKISHLIYWRKFIYFVSLLFFHFFFWTFFFFDIPLNKSCSM